MCSGTGILRWAVLPASPCLASSQTSFDSCCSFAPTGNAGGAALEQQGLCLSPPTPPVLLCEVKEEAEQDRMRLEASEEKKDKELTLIDGLRKIETF